MEPKDLAFAVADALADKKALDIVIAEVEALVSYTSYFVIASGRSDRQVMALAEHVVKRLRAEHACRPLGVEGVEKGQWALLDFGDVVVHIFREGERRFYDLEGLWEDAPRLEHSPPAPAVATAT